jgi:hypothetical protein
MFAGPLIPMTTSGRMGSLLPPSRLVGVILDDYYWLALASGRVTGHRLCTTTALCSEPRNELHMSNAGRYSWPCSERDTRFV